MTYREAVINASKKAAVKGFEQKRAQWLMMDLFGWSYTDYVMMMNDIMPDKKYHQYQAACKRMLAGEPIQYITGFQSFLGEQFEVDERCLIPRPETEEVFMEFIEKCPQHAVVADIGTGSGILAVMLKKMRSDLQVYASDLYEGPLEIAKQNAQLHQTEIAFLQGDALTPFREQNIRLDGLISNPPYIDYSDGRGMADTVMKYEPHQALFAEKNGLAVYEAIIDQLPMVMNEKAWIVFEIGHAQGEAIKRLAEEKYPQIDVQIKADINGNDRIVSFQWTSA